MVILIVNIFVFYSRFMQYLQENDILIVDRGFRDVKTLLEECGLRVYFPSFLERGESQLSDLEANLSRLITKVRWVVEVVNSRIKRWAYLANVVPIQSLHDLQDYIQIVAALCNK